MQLVFGRDTILNVKHEVDWAYIKSWKDKISRKNNINKNKSQREHKYKGEDKILISVPTNLKYGTDANTGPFKITKVNNDGTIRIKRGCVEDMYNICNIKSYYD